MCWGDYSLIDAQTFDWNNILNRCQVCSISNIKKQSRYSIQCFYYEIKRTNLFWLNFLYKIIIRISVSKLFIQKLSYNPLWNSFNVSKSTSWFCIVLSSINKIKPFQSNTAILSYSRIISYSICFKLHCLRNCLLCRIHQVFYVCQMQLLSFILDNITS